MRSLLALGLSMFLVACATGDPLPPPSYDKPTLGPNGQLGGVIGVDNRHWALVDEDLRRGIYWHSVVGALTTECQMIFPEHKDWLAEVSGLLNRANKRAIDAALVLEQTRLERLGEGADRAITALRAMLQADVDTPAIAKSWIRLATRERVTTDRAMTHACGLLFGKEELRGMLRNSAEPLHVYLVRIKEVLPTVYTQQTDLDVLVRRLSRI